MLEADAIRLRDIADRIDLISSWIGGLNEATFMADLRTRDAVALNIQLIGEAARRLNEEVKRRAPEIPWSSIVALRNRIAHGYETVNHRLVWRIVSDDLPGLRVAVARLLAPPPESATTP
jgi:uncharacterized protein with HEPN domain